MTIKPFQVPMFKPRRGLDMSIYKIELIDPDGNVSASTFASGSTVDEPYLDIDICRKTYNLMLSIGCIVHGTTILITKEN